MKKIISLTTGFLLMVTILISWGCRNSANGQSSGDIKEVTIKLKAVVMNGKVRLKLSDSNGNKATDHLITEVPAGGKVIWKLKKFSKIESIERIYSTEVVKKIFEKEPKRQGNSNVFILDVPANVASGTQEEYNIIFIGNNGSKVEIDPYIRIEP